MADTPFLSSPNNDFYPVFDDKEVSPAIQGHLLDAFTALNQLNKAVIAVNAKAANSGTTNVTNVTNLTTGSGGGSDLPGLGKVNMQTSDYVLQSSDAGSLVTMNAAVTTTITLNFTVTVPFFCFIENFGSAPVVLSPNNGATINGVASLNLNPTFYAIVFFDNSNWQAATLPSTTLTLQTNGTPNSSQTLLNLKAGSGVTLANSGGDVTVTATGGGGGWAGSGSGWREDTLGNLECWGEATAGASSAKYATVGVTFPQAFSSTSGLIVVCSPVDFPDGAITPFECYPTSITTTGFTANFTCSVPTGGGGDTIDNSVRVHYRAIGPA